jgi:hypothetical protein
VDTSKYETIREAVKRLSVGDKHISRQLVALLAKQGRIKGAVLFADVWMIPKSWVPVPLAPDHSRNA